VATLISGTRLGPYEILALIGSGGMGEVYRARDTKLDRDVAIKILPEAFASDTERVARFQREAKTLAALNHPNIAAIYGLEEGPAEAGHHRRALVMELVAGDDLSQRIARGPIPINEALPIAKQIADALEAAHEQGIIHRDLKPANIKVREDGTVKVLDFGLAKFASPPEGGHYASDGSVRLQPDLSMSPTMMSPAQMSGVGMILGTAAYMAPEQARGKAVDKRADVWAFGAVLFEMLTGTPPFPGDDLSHILARVIDRDPDWTALPPALSPALRTYLRRCLTKDPRQRIRDIGDVRLALEGAFDAEPATAQPRSHGARRSSWARALPWAVAAAFATAACSVLVLWAPWRLPTAPRVTRTTITSPGPATLRINGSDTDLCISPDGTHVVYVGNGGTQLFVRALDALEPTVIANGTDLRGPFVSPDGLWVGFVSGNILRKVAITGGPLVTLTSIDGGARGGRWTPDDTIIFATSNPVTGLQRVSAGGGTPEVVTRPDHAKGEGDHLWPELLPGGRAVLFTIVYQGVLDTAQVAVRDLRTGTQKVVLRGGSHAHYVASGLASPKQGEGGHLVYVAAGTLRAIPFDLNRLETRAGAVPVLPRLVTTGYGAGDFALAGDGTLVYVDVPGALTESGRTLVWVDRAGKEEPLAAPPRAYQHPRLSPDGARVAVSVSDEERDVWIWDLQRATFTRLTLDPALDWFPVWTPDGRRIVFTSDRGGSPSLWWQPVDGTGVAEQLTTSTNAQFATGITPDGAVAVFNETTPSMGRDMLQVALDGTRKVTPLLQTRFDERNGMVSPDGRWLAYESDSSGPQQIYVRPFPNVGGGQRQVSNAGGTRPLWARSGKELFYFGSDGTLWRVPVEASGGLWQAGAPSRLLERRYFTGAGTTGRTYDVSPDGQRFLMIKASGTEGSDAPPRIIVVQHFDEELKRLVPTK